MLGECFKQLEDQLLSRVSEAVAQRHEPLAQANEERFVEMERKLKELVAAEGNNLRCSFNEWVEEQRRSLHVAVEEALKARLAGSSAAGDSPNIGFVEHPDEVSPAAGQADFEEAKVLQPTAVHSAQDKEREEPLAMMDPLELPTAEDKLTSKLGTAVEAQAHEVWAGTAAAEEAPFTPRIAPRARPRVGSGSCDSNDSDQVLMPLLPSPGSPMVAEELSPKLARPPPLVPQLQAPCPQSRQGWSRVFWGMILFLGILVLVVLAAFCAYPIITVGFLSLFFLWLLYVCGEEPLIQIVSARIKTQKGQCSKKLVVLVQALRTVQGLRSSQENDQQIKAVLWSIFTCFTLFNPEVGYLWVLLESYPPISVFGIVLIVLLVSYGIALCVQCQTYERRLRRSAGSGATTPRGSQAVQEIMREINSILQGSRRQPAEQRVQELMSLSEPDTLNELLERMAHEGSLERVFRWMRDTAGQSARSDLIKMLCMDHVEYLSVRAKLALLHTLMVVRLSSCSVAEAAVESLLLSCHGDRLSELKSMQDTAGDVHSMHKLVFQDVVDQDRRQQILDHFLCEGMSQVAHRVLMASDHFRDLACRGKARQCVPEELRWLQDAEAVGESGESSDITSYSGKGCGHTWLKIITDMDDTLTCSGGRWPAGLDGRYSKGSVYPGVTAFYRELQGGAGVGQLVALSARPHLVGDMMESRIFQKFENLMKDRGLHAMPALLPGSIDSGMKFMVDAGSDKGLRALHDKKFEMFEEFIALYPEFRAVFICDNGQADYAVGQSMFRKYPNNIEQVWVHQVQPREKTFGYEPESDAPIAFFEDYIMAAADAATRSPPLITLEGLLRIVLQSVEDFGSITNWPSDAHREAEVERLNQSIDRACAVLRALGVDDSEVKLIDADRHPRSDFSPAPFIQAEPDPGSATTSGPSSGLSLLSLARGLAKGAYAVGSKSAAATSAPADSAVDVRVDCSVQTDAPEAGVEAGPTALQERGVSGEDQLASTCVVTQPQSVSSTTDAAPQANEAAEKVRAKSIFGRARDLVSGGASSSINSSLVASPKRGTPEPSPKLGAEPVVMPELPLLEASSATEGGPSSPAGEEGGSSQSNPTSSTGISFLGFALDLKSKLSSAASCSKSGDDVVPAVDAETNVQAPASIALEEISAEQIEAARPPAAAVAVVEPLASETLPSAAERSTTRSILGLAGRAAAVLSGQGGQGGQASSIGEAEENSGLVSRNLEEENKMLMQKMACRDQELDELRERLALLESGGTGYADNTGVDTGRDDAVRPLVSPLATARMRPVAAGSSEGPQTTGGSWVSFADSSDVSEPQVADASPAALEEGEQLMQPPAAENESSPSQAVGSQALPQSNSGDGASGVRMSIFSGITRGLRRQSAPAPAAIARAAPPVLSPVQEVSNAGTGSPSADLGAEVCEVDEGTVEASIATAPRAFFGIKCAERRQSLPARGSESATSIASSANLAFSAVLENPAAQDSRGSAPASLQLSCDDARAEVLAESVDAVGITLESDELPPFPLQQEAQQETAHPPAAATNDQSDDLASGPDMLRAEASFVSIADLSAAVEENLSE